LEKTQSKLDDKIAQCNDLKEQLHDKDEEMKEFINKYEKRETNSDDLLNLQSKILDLEHELSKEKEKHAFEIDESEERLRDLLKRNDHLWSQMTKLEQNYKDATEIIKNLNQDVELIEEKLKSNEQKIALLTKEKLDETHLKEKQIEINKNLEKDLSNLNFKLTDLNSKYDFLSTEKYNENEASTNHINSLNRKIEELNETVRNLENFNFSLKLDIEGLNKEKSFIINQNDSSQQKVMQDFLSLQEKHTSVSYQHDKLNKDFSDMNALVKEKERLCANLEAKVNQLRQEKDAEINEKKELLTKLTIQESTISNVK
jgi:chromosome segregation ATPase